MVELACEAVERYYLGQDPHSGGNMHPLRAVTRKLRWCLGTGCVLVLVVWSVSARWWICYDTATWSAVLGNGVFALGISHVGPAPGPPRWIVTDASSLGLRWPEWYKTSHTQIVLPFWLVLLGLGVPTMAAWLPRSRRSRGLCHKCGYDLTGNVSGRCPECGVGRTEQPDRRSNARS
jgi:hypothetical protein